MPKILEGKIIAIKTPKTAIVLIERKFRHPMYKKVIKKSKKFKAHYENIKIEIGDNALIKETRPISKDKSFEIIKSSKNKLKK